MLYYNEIYDFFTTFDKTNLNLNLIYNINDILSKEPLNNIVLEPSIILTDELTDELIKQYATYFQDLKYYCIFKELKHAINDELYFVRINLIPIPKCLDNNYCIIINKIYNYFYMYSLNKLLIKNEFNKEIIINNNKIVKYENYIEFTYYEYEFIYLSILESLT